MENDFENYRDVQDFIAMIGNLSHHPMLAIRNLFDPAAEIIVTRAPGRLDVMGGFADYSGSLVLELPMKEATLAAFQCNPDEKIKIVSLNLIGSDLKPVFEMPARDFLKNGKPIEYAAARVYFKKRKRSSWAAYVAGVFPVLMREKKLNFRTGARILIRSDVPPGAGVSSSAALEVAVMQAVLSAFQIKLNPSEIALLCQKVENLIVGAPCGVMDQMTSVGGEKNRLSALLCQPVESRGNIPIPAELSFWGIDSGTRHAITGADYGSVRAGAFMGYRMIAQWTGLPVEKDDGENLVSVTDPQWRGYLANIPLREFEKKFLHRLPERIKGSEFLAAYSGATDPVTKIEPERVYPVRAATAHPVYEHRRIQKFAKLLQKGVSESVLRQLGDLMFCSHQSYSGCGLGAPGTDRLIELVKKAGPEKGLYGAKITGGGSGGTVAVLAKKGMDETVNRIAAEYSAATGRRSQVFHGSSPGAASFGYVRLIDGRIVKAN